MKNTANIITASRIALCVPLVFLSPEAPAFYSLYALGGVTDMLDGHVARKSHTESDLGSRLDSMADLVFIAVCAVKLIPHIKLGAVLWLWAGLIAVLRLCNIALGYICRGSFSVPHTVLNKITGALLFIYPLSIVFDCTKAAAIPLCLMATAAAVQETWLLCEVKEAFSRKDEE